MKTGDYVRTKNGLIAKIININDFREPSLKYGIEANYIVDIGFIGDEDIKISSQNIIDLIEVGDVVVVSGVKYTVVRADDMFDGKLFVEIIGKEPHFTTIEHLIKSNRLHAIVTKEQFERREYKVGD